MSSHRHSKGSGAAGTGNVMAKITTLLALACLREPLGFLTRHVCSVSLSLSFIVFDSITTTITTTIFNLTKRIQTASPTELTCARRMRRHEQGGGWSSILGETGFLNMAGRHDACN